MGLAGSGCAAVPVVSDYSASWTQSAGQVASASVATLPIKLWPGMKIGQLCFFQLSSPAEHPYGHRRRGSHYQGQRGPTASRSWENFTRTGL